MPGIFDNLVTINNEETEGAKTQSNQSKPPAKPQQTEERKVTPETFYGKDFNSYYNVENF